MLVEGEHLDAVFLDIRMPGLDGLDFTRLLTGFAEPPHVVFVTAHDDCAVTAYELGALDYLLKPVRPERLAESVRRVAAAAHRPAPPAEEAAPDPADEMIPVELGGRTRLVSRRTVTHVEAQGDYVRLHTADGGYLVRMPLSVLTKRWEGAGFIRIHRSTLVASAHITELRFDGGRAAVQIGDELLQVSRRHTREVRDLLVRRFHQPGEDGALPGRPAMGDERRAVTAGTASGGAPPDAPATGPEPSGADPGDPSHPGRPCAPPGPRTGDAEARALIRAQLRIALGTGAFVMAVVTGLPALLALVPAIARARLGGVPLSCIVLALGIQPVWIAVAFRQLRRAERAERELTGTAGPR
ncbi:LytTR family transcriptional regulator DNA-binding domain-containing protein [Actinomadura madurae]|nr:LytTR family transcriptional regulator DNA-binding domain-containing protein [Actinomadura madurae]